MEETLLRRSIASFRFNGMGVSVPSPLSMCWGKGGFPLFLTNLSPFIPEFYDWEMLPSTRYACEPMIDYD